jgi:hypothetical protein
MASAEMEPYGDVGSSCLSLAKLCFPDKGNDRDERAVEISPGNV